jgi:hypothetical protein
MGTFPSSEFQRFGASARVISPRSRGFESMLFSLKPQREVIAPNPFSMIDARPRKPQSCIAMIEKG